MCHARIKVSDNMSTNSFFTLGLMSNIAWQRVEVYERYKNSLSSDTKYTQPNPPITNVIKKTMALTYPRKLRKSDKRNKRQ